MCDGWKYEGFFCANVVSNTGRDEDLESTDIDVLKRAFNLINENLEFVGDYYDRHPHLKEYSACMLARLSGGNTLWPRPMIDEDPWAESEHWVYLATNAYWSRFMQFNWAFLRGVSNTYGDSDGEEATCAILALAGIIVHEASHSCGTLEDAAHLVEYYFRRRVVKDQKISSAVPYCCATKALAGGYDAENYTGGEVAMDKNYEYANLIAEDGRPVLSRECAG